MNNLNEHLSRMPSEKQRHLLDMLLTHLADAYQIERLQSLLANFEFLEAKVTALGPQPLIDDYNLAFTRDFNIPKENLEVLRTIQKAIRLSAHILAQDRTLLAGQLMGRLLSYKVPKIVTLLEQAQRDHTTPWLSPQGPSLIPPYEPLLRTLAGHKESITSVALTPDGRRAISADMETLIIWDLEGEEALYTIPNRDRDGFGVVVMPDGRQAICTQGSQLRILDLEDGADLFSLNGLNKGLIFNVSMTADGRQALVASSYIFGSSFTIRCWDLEQKTETFTAKCLDGGTVMTAFLSPDGYRAISALDNNLIVWDISQRKKLFTLPGHAEAITKVVVTPDGHYGISASTDCTLKVWDLAQGVLLHSLEGHSRHIFSVAITSDGHRAVSASDDGTLKLWDLEEGVALHTLRGQSSPIRAVAMTPNGHRVISGSLDGIIKVWDLEDGVVPPPSSSQSGGYHSGPVMSVAISSNSQYAISGSLDETLAVWYKSVAILFCQFPIRGYPWHPRYNAAEWFGPLFYADDSFFGITAVAVTPDMQRIVIGSADTMVKVLNLTSKLDLVDIITEVIQVKTCILKGHATVIRAVAVTPDSQHAISGSEDGTVKVWNLKLSKELYTLGNALREPIIALAVVSNGQHVVAATSNVVKVWDLESKTIVTTFNCQDCKVITVMITSKGPYVASQNAELDLELWELESKAKLCSLSHSVQINATALTADEQFLVSASDDGALRVWDLANETIIAKFMADSPLLSCAIAQDGLTIVAGDELGKVHFLRLEEKDRMHTNPPHSISAEARDE